MGNLKQNSVDLIFADPPYKLSNDGFSVSAGRRVSVNKGEWDRSIDPQTDWSFHRDWLAACHQVLKPDGSLWVSGTYHSIYQCGWALQSAGWHILNEVVWYKPNAAPNLSCRMLTASHETLIWAKKQKVAKHHFNYSTLKAANFTGDRFKNPGRQLRSVWEIPTPPKGEKAQGKHPTQKPRALLDRIILATSKPGDLVLDPFAGSGTTGLSAIASKCDFIGIETEEKYLELAKARFLAQYGQA